MSVYTYCFILSMAFLLLILYFVKRRVLEFKYSILWIVVSAAMVILSINRRLTEYMAGMINISYAPAFLFLTGIVFVLLLLFYLTIIISDIQRRVTRVIQEIGILKSEEGYKR